MFLYFKQHLDTEEVIILQTRKQKYYFDSTIGKYKVDFHLSRESKMSICNRFRVLPSLFDRLYTIHYLFPVCECVYVRNKIQTCLYTILAIKF
jgi:hypothetical protein